MGQSHLSAFSWGGRAALGPTGLEPDISARKRAEEALAEQRELMDYVIRHDPNAIAVYDNELRMCSSASGI